MTLPTSAARPADAALRSIDQRVKIAQFFANDAAGESDSNWSAIARAAARRAGLG